MGAALITVSTDTEFTHLAWKRDEKELAQVKYLMGSDPTGRLSRLFGVWDPASGLALRGTFIIAPDGTRCTRIVNTVAITAIQAQAVPHGTPSPFAEL